MHRDSRVSVDAERAAEIAAFVAAAGDGLPWVALDDIDLPREDVRSIAARAC